MRDVLLGNGDTYNSDSQFVWHKMEVEGELRSFILQYVPHNQTREMFIYYSFKEGVRRGRILNDEAARTTLSSATFYSYITNRSFLTPAFVAISLENQAARPGQFFQAVDEVVNPLVNEALNALGRLLAQTREDGVNFRLSRAVAAVAGAIAEKKLEGRWCSIS